MNNSNKYFEFLSAVWDQLPEEDRGKFGELWKGYEQVLAAMFQKYMELNLNTAVKDLQPWATERWLPYNFDSSNFIERAASITGTQDLSVGVNLSKKNLLKIRINGGNAFEVDISGKNPETTFIPEIIEKINLVTQYKFAKSVFDGTILQLVSPTKGVNSSIEILPTSKVDANACEIVLGVDPDTLPEFFPKFRFPYTIPYGKVRTIPTFQDAIRDESYTTLLVEGVDYTVEDGAVAFSEIPPKKLWAPRTNTDEETPWNNYGFLTGIYQKNSPRYVGVIQGLWFAFWNGPKPSNIKKALYLLFGLPSANEAGTITSVIPVIPDISPATITLKAFSGVDYTYTVSTGLNPIVSVGQIVGQFDPLVDGIEVFDKINTPGFIEEQIGREGIQRFLTDNATRGYGDTDETKALRTLEEYTFLPQISVEAFIYPDINLKNVRLFLDAFKPLNKTYLFQVIVGLFKDLVDAKDRISIHDYYDLTPTLDGNETSDLDQIGLAGYEISDIPALDLDPHGILFRDNVEIEVWESSTLIDSFPA